MSEKKRVNFYVNPMMAKMLDEILASRSLTISEYFRECILTDYLKIKGIGEYGF